jgi:hypothetical protein
MAESIEAADLKAHIVDFLECLEIDPLEFFVIKDLSEL